MNSIHFYKRYVDRLAQVLAKLDYEKVAELELAIKKVWESGKRIYLVGNGGSAANASHVANDFNYGVAKNKNGKGIRAHALGANSAVITCLGNDIGYENIFSQQIDVMGESGDLLIAFSGSGNSPNILKAIRSAKEKNMTTYGLLGYSGGQAKEMVDVALHFAVDDMQISEDLQLIVLHMISQNLCES